MIIISPIEQGITSATFFSPDADSLKTHKLSIACKTNDISYVELDGVNIANNFFPVAGSAGFSMATIDLAAGQHHIKSQGTFNAYSYGFGRVQAYSYNLGANTTNLYSSVQTTITATSNPVCKGHNVTFTSTMTNEGNQAQFLWSVNGVGLNNNLPILSSRSLSNDDTIQLKVVSSNLCVSEGKSNIIKMKVNDLPKIQFVPVDTMISYGSSITLSPIISGTPAKYTWQPNYQISNINIKNPVVSPLKSARYSLSIVDTNGCKISNSFPIKTFRDIILPNAFTPNRDGKNELFRIPPDCQADILNFSIYNRWGQRVFVSSDKANGWNGYFKGSAADVGSYAWIITYMNPISGKSVLVKGNVLLLR
jgi:gliding motility-associated-like protein